MSRRTELASVVGLLMLGFLAACGSSQSGPAVASGGQPAARGGQVAGFGGAAVGTGGVQPGASGGNGGQIVRLDAAPVATGGQAGASGSNGGQVVRLDAASVATGGQAGIDGGSAKGGSQDASFTAPTGGTIYKDGGAATPVDAPQLPPGATGTSCGKNSDCPSGICLPLGNGKNVCTSTCTTVADCLGGWTCAAILGQTSNICQCKPTTEICDGGQ